MVDRRGSGRIFGRQKVAEPFRQVRGVHQDVLRRQDDTFQPAKDGGGGDARDDRIVRLLVRQARQSHVRGRGQLSERDGGGFDVLARAKGEDVELFVGERVHGLGVVEAKERQDYVV